MKLKRIERIGNFYSFTVYNNGYMWSRDVKSKAVRYKAGPADLMQMLLASEVCIGPKTEALCESLIGGGWALAIIDYEEKKAFIREFSSIGELAEHIKKEWLGDFKWGDATEEDELQAQETLNKMLESF